MKQNEHSSILLANYTFATHNIYTPALPIKSSAINHGSVQPILAWAEGARLHHDPYVLYNDKFTSVNIRVSKNGTEVGAMYHVIIPYIDIRTITQASEKSP